MSYQHSFVPDDEGLFCLFCGRTAVEHLGPAAALVAPGIKTYDANARTGYSSWSG